MSHKTDDGLDILILAIIEKNGEHTFRSFASACRMLAEKSEKDLDGTSATVWQNVANSLNEVAEYLEKN